MLQLSPQGLSFFCFRDVYLTAVSVWGKHVVAVIYKHTFVAVASFVAGLQYWAEAETIVHPEPNQFSDVDICLTLPRKMCVEYCVGMRDGCI